MEEFDEIEYLNYSFEDDPPTIIEDRVDPDIFITSAEEVETVKKPRKKNNKISVRDILKSHEKEVFDEALLNLVFERPPLYDYCLPVQERSPAITSKLWLEVLEEVKERFSKSITVVIVKDTFKYHRDNYTRYKSISRLPSGSGTVPKIPPKFMEILQQLDTVIAKRKQITNIKLIENTSQVPASPEYIPPKKKNRPSLSSRPNSSLSENRPTSSLSNCSNDQVSTSIDKLVGAVNQSANRCEFRDKAQSFGDQVAWSMRGLDEVEFYEASIYINKYFHDLALNK